MHNTSNFFNSKAELQIIRRYISTELDMIDLSLVSINEDFKSLEEKIPEKEERHANQYWNVLMREHRQLQKQKKSMLQLLTTIKQQFIMIKQTGANCVSFNMPIAQKLRHMLRSEIMFDTTFMNELQAEAKRLLADCDVEKKDDVEVAAMFKSAKYLLTTVKKIKRRIENLARIQFKLRRQIIAVRHTPEMSITNHATSIIRLFGYPYFISTENVRGADGTFKQPVHVFFDETTLKWVDAQKSRA